VIIKSVPAFEASDGTVHATKEGVIYQEIYLVLDKVISERHEILIATSFVVNMIMQNRQEIFELLKELS